jgi:outer membrane protein
MIMLCAALVALPLGAGTARSETLMEALASAYSNNATLNASRAGTRATDENVPKALSGFRPQVSAFAQAGYGNTQSSTRNAVSLGGASTFDNFYYAPLVVGFQVVQTLYAGGRLENGVKAAEASVKAAREQLRYQEQTTLADAVTAYMDVIATRDVLVLRKSNVDFLKEQVRAASDRFSVGEGTKTDVSQAEAALAAAQAQVSLAEANALSAVGNYQSVIGHKPGKLAPASPIARMVPASLDVAVAASRAEHPAIIGAIHGADAAAYNVEIAEGALLPSLSVTGKAQHNVTGLYGSQSATSTMEFDASVMAQLSVPIYQGGGEYSEIRRAKEELGQAKIQVDAARDSVSAALTSAWGAFGASTSAISAAKAGVDASQLALDGVIEEQKVGQRTTLDVLNAQSTLISAKLSLVDALRNSVVASYAVVSAMGRLDPDHIGLKVPAYKPEQHYQQVRDAWVGLRTPDGR